MVRPFRRNGSKHYGTGSSRKRLDYARRQSCDTAIAGFALSVEQVARHHPQGGSEVAEAGDGRGHEDRAEGASFDSSDGSGGSHDRCLSAPHTAAAGRLPLCSPAVDPSPDVIRLSMLPATAWYLASTTSSSSGYGGF